MSRLSLTSPGGMRSQYPCLHRPRRVTPSPIVTEVVPPLADGGAQLPQHTQKIIQGASIAAHEDDDKACRVKVVWRSAPEDYRASAGDVREQAPACSFAGWTSRFCSRIRWYRGWTHFFRETVHVRCHIGSVLSALRRDKPHFNRFE